MSVYGLLSAYVLSYFPVSFQFYIIYAVNIFSNEKGLNTLPDQSLCIFFMLLLKDFVKYTTNYRQTRMTTFTSSEARRNQTSILNRGRENHVSP